MSITQSIELDRTGEFGNRLHIHAYSSTAGPCLSIGVYDKGNGKYQTVSFEDEEALYALKWLFAMHLPMLDALGEDIHAGHTAPDPLTLFPSVKIPNGEPQ